MNKNKNKNIVLILGLFLFSLFLGMNITTGISQDPFQNTNPIEPVLQQTVYDIPANESEKIKVTTNLDFDNIVVTMTCEGGCQVLFYIATDADKIAIEAGTSHPAEVAEIYLEDRTSLNEVPYQVPTAGDWWVVLDNSPAENQIQVTMSIGIQPIKQETTVTSVDTLAVVAGIGIIGIVALKRKY